MSLIFIINIQKTNTSRSGYKHKKIEIAKNLLQYNTYFNKRYDLIDKCNMYKKVFLEDTIDKLNSMELKKLDLEILKP